jgi:multidrug efflux pump subunit AcrA (membrane-fusion protein)
VDVELERLPDVLLAPRDAFVTESGKTYAWVKSGTTFEKRAVALGKTNDVDVVVTSGLAAGDMVKRNPEEAPRGK